MAKKQKKPANGTVDSRSNAAATDYQVGRGRPPKHAQFKPGQSGNPKGRPRGSANARTIVERVLNRKVSVRKGDKKQTMTTLQAITENYSVKAVQGDRHAANFVVNLGAKTGVIGPNQDEPAANDQSVTSVIHARPSEALLPGVDVHLLGREEASELSRLLEVIDSKAGVTALSIAQFERLQHLIGKGRENLPEAIGRERGVP